jgi:hypothetical protein
MKRLAVTVVLAGFVTALLPIAAEAGCRWAGTAPFCSGRCGGNEIQIARRGGSIIRGTPYGEVGEPPYGRNCATGSKALCCTRCPPGLVWREAGGNRFDTFCVTPAERAAARRR